MALCFVAVFGIAAPAQAQTPNDLSISTGPTANVSETLDAGTTVFEPTAGSANLNVDQLLFALEMGNVRVTTGVDVSQPDLGSVYVQSPISGVVAPAALTFVANNSVYLSGAVTVSDLNLNVDAARLAYFGDVVGVAGLDVSGPLRMDGSSVVTSGSQAYDGPVVLGADMRLSTVSGGVGFGSTVDGDYALQVSSGSGVALDGAVGSGTALKSVEIAAVGTTALGGGVSTTGSQVYNGAVAVGGTAATVELRSIDGPVAFASTVVGSGQSLTVQSGVGAVTFGGAVSGLHDLTANSVSGATFDGTVNVDSVSVGAPGTAYLNGGVIAASGSQTYQGPVALGSDTTLSTVSGGVAFGSTIDGGYALTVNSGNGATFAGKVGAVTELSSMDISAVGTIALNGGTFTTAGAQIYDAPVAIGADASLATTVTGDVAFGSTVDGGYALQIQSGNGVAFGGAVGSGTPLGSLEITAAGTTALGGAVSTTGSQTYHGAVALGADTTLSTVSGDVAFGSTVDGGYALQIQSGNGVAFGGAVGSGTPLGSLEITAAGTTALSGGTLVTSGSQAYDGPVVLGADMRLSTVSGGVGFGSTVDGGYALQVSSGSGVALDGAVGGGTALRSLEIAAVGTIGLAGSVSTSGSQVYNGAVSVGGTAASVDLSSVFGPVTFASTVGGSGQSLVVQAGVDAVTFGGAVSGLHDLTANSLTAATFDGTVSVDSVSVGASGTANLDGGAITTSLSQTYQGPVVLGTDTTLRSSSGAVNLASTVELAAHALTIDGAGTITGPISGTGSLVKQGPGVLALSSGNTYSGGTSVTGGLASFSAPTSFGSGTVRLDGGGLRWASGNTSDISSVLEPLGAAGATFDTNGNDVALAAPLTGTGGLSKAGAGALTLSADSTFGGPTDVQEGTLAVEGSLAGVVSVQGGATLTVSGTIAGAVTVEAAGTLTCSGGTLSGGVTNNGGTTSPVPEAPTGVSASAGAGLGEVTVSFSPGAAHCYPVSYTATASPGGHTASGSGSPLTVAGLSNGIAYTFAVTATSPIGRSAPSQSSNEVTLGDTTPPTGSVTSPANDSWVGGASVALAAEASDTGSGVASVQFQYHDGSAWQDIGAADTSAPYTASWNTTGLSDGSYEVRVHVLDNAGNPFDSSPVTLKVDNTPPEVTITAPASANPSTPTVYSYGSVPNAGYTCTDSGSGVASPGGCVGTVDGTTAVADGSALVGSVGLHSLTVRARDILGNESTKTHYYDVLATTAFAGYDGQQFVNQGARFLLGDRLTSPAGACVSGRSVGFALGEDPTASDPFATHILTWPGAYPTPPWMATTDASGQAAISTTAGTTAKPWPEGAYDVLVNFAGVPSACAAATDQGTLTVAGPGDAASGGGWYTLAGSGRSNFGFTVNRVPGTNPAQYKGQFLLINTGKWRLKGTLNSYSKARAAASGSASGTGNLFWWDTGNPLFPLGYWHQTSDSPVSFAISFTAGTKKAAGAFGIVINHAIAPGEPARLPNSDPQSIKGGTINVR